MDWREYIESDPSVLVGKPIIKGTRILVEFILRLLSEGWTEEQILENYPSLTRVSLQAVFAFSAECIHDETVYSLGDEVV